ncbi:BnaCnng75850D [Brassica napus]|uniref:BnaCnng75850D protein n=1 Tax=Brassica napus TaxID=3708 RepID=A0A078JZF2_BRANA|nr:BnaCnng75850D [Brassica napus]
MVILSQTIRLHRNWLTRVAKDADSLKRLSSVRYLLQSGQLRRKLIIKSSDKSSNWKTYEEAAAEASEEVHTTVAGLTKEDIKTMFKDIVDAMREGFGTCLKEIKYLSERVEAVEKKVGITTKRKRTSAQNTTPPPKPTLEPGSESVNGTNAGRKILPEDKGSDNEDARYLEKRDAALALCRAKMIIPNKKLYPGYNPFAPIDKKKLKELADWLKTCPHYRTPLDKKPRTSRTCLLL